MKRSIILIMISTVALTTILVAYGFPYLQSYYTLSPLQFFLLIIVIIFCSGIITSASVEYIFSISLNEFLDNLKQAWNKNGSLDSFDNNKKLKTELKNILNTINTITQKSAERIKNLESKGGYDDDYYRLVTTMSHQLRTPLTGLKWALGMMQDDSLKGKQIDIVILKDSIDATSRIGDIIEKLLVGVNENKSGKKNFEAIDIERCLDDVIKESSLLMMEHNMKISVVKTTALVPLVKGINYEIRFVLHSLITNAINYGKSNSPVTITLGQEEAFVVIIVHNEGIGIKEEENAMIFSQFNRGTEAIKLNPDGAGLGLYLARNIVINHGGSISFESNASKGTSFFVKLPLSNKSELETAIHY